MKTIEDLKKEFNSKSAEAETDESVYYKKYSKFLEQKLTSPKEPSNYFTNEKYKFQIVDSETGKNISDYEMTGMELHQLLYGLYNSFLSENPKEPVKSADETVKEIYHLAHKGVENITHEDLRQIKKKCNQLQLDLRNQSHPIKTEVFICGNCYNNHTNKEYDGYCSKSCFDGIRNQIQ